MKKYIIYLTLLLPFLLVAQRKQPKIGLILSGGGAKGFAHIGVLKEIDKVGLQIDYIGGTSMGAIIGGLYAAGYSGLQIEELVKEIDFASLLTDELDRNTSTFFDKEFREKTFVTLPVNKGKIGFPKGISKGQKVLNVLTQILAPVQDISDFSELPIPFFCIATDIENGREVILESGFLPLALRASASFPTLLTPVLLDKKLLVDGGVVNNFPVNIIKSKGADIVIGVDVQSKLFDQNKITSVVSVLNQIVSFQMAEKTDAEKKGIDIYIRPETSDLTVIDFDNKDEILKRGDSIAKEYNPVFEELAKKQKNKREIKSPRIEDKKVFISYINLYGNKAYTNAYVLGKLNIKRKDSLNRKEITEKINLLFATKNFDRIEYKIVKSKRNDEYGLQFDLVESDVDGELSVGLHYDFLYKSSLLANYTHKNLLKKNDLFSVDMIFGDNLRYNFNYFVDNGFYVSYGFKSRYNHFTGNSKFNLPEDLPNISNINLNYTDFTNQIFLQTTFSRKFVIGLGAEHKRIRAVTETINSTAGAETILDKTNYYNSFGYLKLDTYDKRYFVTKGYFADLNFKWYMTSNDYNGDFKPFAQVRGTLGFATTLMDKFTFQVTSDAGFTLNNPTSNIFDFYLGGYNKNYINNFVALYGYDFADISNNSFVKSEFNFRYRFAEKHYASFIANYARIDDNVFRDINLFKEIKSGYALGYSFDNFVGPIEIKYSWSPDTNRGFWLFNLGFWF